MHVISRKRLADFWAEHPDAEAPLKSWFDVARRAAWGSLDQTRADFPHADQVRVATGRVVTVFNVGGNNYRLVTAIHYNVGRVFALRVMTHADYDRGRSRLGGPGKWRDSL